MAVEMATPTMAAVQTVQMTQVDKKGKKIETEDIAIFITLPGAGKNHMIQLKPTQERDEQLPGAIAPTRVAVRNSGQVVRFSEGVATIHDPKIIKALLVSDPVDPHWCGFGRDYDIDRSDSTGYWRKHYPEMFDVEEVTTVRLKTRGNASPAIGTGPMTIGQKTAAA